ncbi:kinase-like protein [Rhizophagus irregularis]|uniref:Kinase-like protein n=1 Tax=Rhizophagus irregularis TaxID=588596 RepID=A0A2I1H859_9GLOM|nr:kinase-like protein [Rhizophagus irregularis]
MSSTNIPPKSVPGYSSTNPFTFTRSPSLPASTSGEKFTAHWPQGPIRAWDTTANNWKRGWEQVNSDVIILKQIKNSDNMTSDFLNELSAYHQFSNLVTHVVRCYGISRCPFTRELIVVTSYARDGDLRQYNSRNFDTFTWEQRIITLKDIAVGLVTIHKAGLLHHRMIMFELWSGRRPFEGREYDAFLAIEICSGIRPKITSNIPDYYSKVMQSCWDNDPDMRPTSRDLEITFNSWIDKITKRELVCPKMPERESNVSTPISSSVLSENITSQSLPSLSVEQHKILEEIDKRREALYQNYLNQQLIERAERESRNKGPLNPMTWTTELKSLADKIFGNQASKDIEIRPIGATDTTSPEEIADDDNNEIQIGIWIDGLDLYNPIPYLTNKENGLMILPKLDKIKIGVNPLII